MFEMQDTKKKRSQRQLAKAMRGPLYQKMHHTRMNPVSAKATGTWYMWTQDTTQTESHVLPSTDELKFAEPRETALSCLLFRCSSNDDAHADMRSDYHRVLGFLLMGIVQRLDQSGARDQEQRSRCRVGSVLRKESLDELNCRCPAVTRPGSTRPEEYATDQADKVRPRDRQDKARSLRGLT
jgi:hypothetical protein